MIGKVFIIGSNMAVEYGSKYICGHDYTAQRACEAYSVQHGIFNVYSAEAVEHRIAGNGDCPRYKPVYKHGICNCFKYRTATVKHKHCKCIEHKHYKQKTETACEKFLTESIFTAIFSPCRKNSKTQKMHYNGNQHRNKIRHKNH